MFAVRGIVNVNEQKHYKFRDECKYFIVVLRYCFPAQRRKISKDVFSKQRMPWCGTAQVEEFLQIIVPGMCTPHIRQQEQIADPAQIADDSRDNLATSSNAVAAMV